MRHAPAHFARMAARLRTMTAVATSTSATPRPTSDQAASDGSSTEGCSGCAITALAVSLPPPAALPATAPARVTRALGGGGVDLGGRGRLAMRQPRGDLGLERGELLEERDAAHLLVPVARIVDAVADVFAAVILARPRPQIRAVALL